MVVVIRPGLGGLRAPHGGGFRIFVGGLARDRGGGAFVRHPRRHMVLGAGQSSGLWRFVMETGPQIGRSQPKTPPLCQVRLREIRSSLPAARSEKRCAHSNASAGWSRGSGGKQRIGRRGTKPGASLFRAISCREAIAESLGSARNFHAKIAKSAKASWVNSLHRMGSARLFLRCSLGAFEKSLVGLGVLCVLCVRTATFGFSPEDPTQRPIARPRG